MEQLEDERRSSGQSGEAMPSPPRREAREKELLDAYGQIGDANEVLNERAVAVMKRMSDKLTGRDFLQEARLRLFLTPSSIRDMLGNNYSSLLDHCGRL